MRLIRDTYELPDDGDDDGWGMSAPRGPKPRGFPVWLAFVIVGVLMRVAGGAAINTVNARERDDVFCIGCHTAPEEAYHKRAQEALGGAFAVDLSSYHYQQIRGQGGQIRCISCHAGDGGTNAYLAKYQMTAQHAWWWLVNRTDDRLQKTAITQVVRSGITRTVPMGSLAPLVPALSNDGCAGCHTNTLLVAGIDNHIHNSLPVAYQLWKNGARLTPPRGTKDIQAVVARGLTQYNTTLQCAQCHQTHRALETDLYIDQAELAARCAQCHIEGGKGPRDVTLKPVQK